MTRVLPREEEESREPEITLSTASLLGLFLGLVLICGVFFGFGYSVGRRATANLGSSAANDNGIVDANGSGASPAADAEPAAPESGSHPSAAPKRVAEAGNTVTLPVVEPPAPVAPASRRMANGNASQPEAPATMVQVAAVVRQEDADVLVTALRRLGYAAVVRSGAPQDKLLHVQVGPFASRAEAEAMKKKLAANGYNAIIKP